MPWPTFQLTPQDQALHATVFGRTGSGKSKLLQSIFLQHLALGHGVCLIEPHHDLSSDTLCTLIERGFFRDGRAFERLVYIDWASGFVPFNILAEDGRTDPHTRALNALEGMVRVWPELTSAPTFQTLFLSGLLCLIANELPITYLEPLLTDPAFRALALARTADPLVHRTFASYEALRLSEQAVSAGSTLRRAFMLLFSPASRLSLGQPENWLDFRRLMDEEKSIIINLGNVPDADTRRLLGALLMVQIEQAALSRTDLHPSDRQPFTVLVDEWPSFAASAETLSTILSQTRKFNLRLYLAAQSLSQVESGRLVGALENCRLSIAFGLGRLSAELQAKHIGEVDPYTVKEPAQSATGHTSFLPVLEAFEEWTKALTHLPPQYAYVKLGDRAARRIKTLTVRPASVNEVAVGQVLDAYRQCYQRSRVQAEDAIRQIPVPAVIQRPATSEPAYTSVFDRAPATPLVQ